MDLVQRISEVDPTILLITGVICVVGSYMIRQSVHSLLAGLIFYPVLLMFAVTGVAIGDDYLRFTWDHESLYLPLLVSFGMCIGYVLLIPVMRILNRVY